MFDIAPFYYLGFPSKMDRGSDRGVVAELEPIARWALKIDVAIE